MKGYQFATATRNGLTQIVENPNVHWANSSSESSLIAYTGHKFASGWTYGRAGIICLCTTVSPPTDEYSKDSYDTIISTNNLINGDGSSTSGWSNGGGTFCYWWCQYVTTQTKCISCIYICGWTDIHYHINI